MIEGSGFDLRDRALHPCQVGLAQTSFNISVARHSLLRHYNEPERGGRHLEVLTPQSWHSYTIVYRMDSTTVS